MYLHLRTFNPKISMNATLQSIGSVGRQFKNSRITCMCNDSKDDSQIDLNWLDRVLISNTGCDIM